MIGISPKGMSLFSLPRPVTFHSAFMDATKRGRSARCSLDTGSDFQATITKASRSTSSSLGKRETDDAPGPIYMKKQRIKNELITSDAVIPPSSESKNGIDQLNESSGVVDTVEMMISSEEAAEFNAAVAASAEQLEEQLQAPPAKPRKGRRVRKTNLEKMEILAFVDQGGSQGAAAEKFGVSRTAVTKMVKERAAISAQAFVESATSSRKVLQYQHKLSVIEDMLYKWQMQVELNAPTLKVTGELLQSKAMEFRNKILADYCSELSDDVVMSLTDFKASNGWLHRYMQRRSMRSLSKHTPGVGTLIGSDKMTSDLRVQKIRDVLINIAPNCIWSLDELTLRHRSTSSRLESNVNLDVRSLDQISVALAVSASGEKLHLQVVGKDPTPESLKDVDTLTTYGVEYRDHYRAAHDASTIANFIHVMNHEATARKEVWYLVMNSCTIHVSAAHVLNPSGSFRNGFSFNSIVLLFLPPGPSKDAHPLHQGIFKSFKLRFRLAMLQSLLHEYEQWTVKTKAVQRTVKEEKLLESEVFDVHAHTHMRNTLSWLHTAWENVLASSIRNAWTTSLYPSTPEPGDLEVNTAPSNDEDTKAYTELLCQLSQKPALQKTLGIEFIKTPVQLMVELLEFDKCEATEADELVKDNDIVIESLAAQGLLRDTPRASVLDGAKSDNMAVLTAREANSSLSQLLQFVSQEDDNLLTLSERRTGRATLLILQRLLLKARERELEGEAATDFTV